MPPTGEWSVTCSAQANRIFNPIRAVSDASHSSLSTKSLIKVSVGDPTLDEGYLPTSKVQQAALQEAVNSCQYGGYRPAAGTDEARAAVAEYWKRYFVSTAALKSHIVASHVVMTSGGSHAIQMAIASIANPGDNILLPAPGFPHYTTIAVTYDIEQRYYNLDPEKNWEANAEEIKSLCDARTKLLVMTNPSNPCGSNFSREHVELLVRTAEELKVPIFSDEIYAGMVFQHEENPNKTFVSVADVDTVVPRVILGGTAKSHLVPGWRIAWLLFVDPAGHGADYFRGIHNDTSLLVGPNTLGQASLPAALLKTPSDYLPRVTAIIAESAMTFYHAINNGSINADPERRMLIATRPQAAMYVMVRIVLEHFNPAVVRDDRTFSSKLFEEENVQVVPGTAFHAPDCFRVVITRPDAVLEEAAQRMIEFCERHRSENRLSPAEAKEEAADDAEDTKSENKAEAKEEAEHVEEATEESEKKDIEDEL
ncbi:tyrosine aminotransferase [Leptomonas pyrrhocoris]|uniref:Tyrosine aminotransferase n=1 Tax=Leptomonas pyrrhocoris TaxID=157538 RepID=A0A0M9G1A4_LEPPY|nr:tyrosine aminotransferase [Leptomonas pyrrhocoris]KPA80203.1 tyrosine aminotransferase [Leptomonas pyrrhocoris]|eukprot:XP_015658642.1 tyrosine aminotransferase [Leptomonas pyrrhocoris]